MTIEWRIIPGWPQYEVSAVGGIRRVVRSTGFGGGEARLDVAARFGISERTISDIMTGKSWGHLTGIPGRERPRA